MSGVKTMLALLIACAATGALQAQAKATDPVTGTWTGTMARDGDGSATTVTMQLRLSGSVVTGEVTGPKLTPGDVKAGTFDAASGAIKFQVAVRGEGAGLVDFEGKVVGGTATGTLRMGGESGTFKVARGAPAPAPAAAGAPAQAAPATALDTMRTAVRRGFTEVSGWVTKAADLVPPDKYAYRPVQTVRTFGQLVAHVADGYSYYCGRGAGRNVQWSDATEKGATDKATVVAKLRQAAAACTAAYGGTGPFPPLMENVAHTNLHYGNLITYMRMLGLTPPSS